MELKDFVEKVLLDLDSAVSEANNKSQRMMRFKGVKESRTAVEFDIAVTVESTDGKSGSGGIKVLSFMQASGEASSQQKFSTVSRVSFGVDVSQYTNEEIIEMSQSKPRASGNIAL